MRKHSIFIIIAQMFVFLTSSYAVEIEDHKIYCTNLAKFTCAPGVSDDGTGTTSKNNNDKALEFMVTYKSELSKRFNEVLSNATNSTNSDFKRLAAHALGLTRGDCISQEPDKIKICNSKITEGLVDLGLRDFPYNRNKVQTESASNFQAWSDGQADLEETIFVRDNPIYVDILKQTTATLTAKSPESGKTQDKIHNKIFPEVKKLLLKRVSKLPISDINKKIMTSKIDAIKFIESPCLSESPLKAIEKFTVNAFYEPSSNTFHVCGGLIELSNSDFDLASIVAHELSHSIDPCSIQLQPEGMAFRYKEKTMEGADKEYPIQGLILCLRSENSIGAKNIADQYQTSQGSPYSNYSQVGKSSPVYYNYGGGYQGEATQSKQKPFNYCMLKYDYTSQSMKYTDQITESTSDWFASEVITEYIEQNYPSLNQEQWQNGLTNIFKALCSSDKPVLNNIDVHPLLEKRLNAIFLSNPKIRQKLGCTDITSKYDYCDVQNPDLLMQKYNTANLPVDQNGYQPAYKPGYQPSGQSDFQPTSQPQNKIPKIPETPKNPQGGTQ